MQEIPIHNVHIQGGYWGQRLTINARQAIFHQWDQLEASGCIDNFRIAAGEKEGFRQGWFFADSDAYKWLEAAARITGEHPDPQLTQLMDEFIALLGRAQAADGYIYTYNQIHFPGSRWENLHIEHELYCHGHLIEAGVSHHLVTGEDKLLEFARRAADRIVSDFLGNDTTYSDGHEEIEIALLRLYQATRHTPCLELARQFLEQRGRHTLFAVSLLRQITNVARRNKIVQEQKQLYIDNHPNYSPPLMPPGNAAKKPPNSLLRWYASALSGKFFQEHAPVRHQKVPVGHAVRFGYLETALAMLVRLQADTCLSLVQEQAWERMVTRRMYVTGGLGALPDMEGFGKDYELDAEYAYAETCAALANIFWNWEMALITGEAKYSDLLEWQLYNSAGVGMGLDGNSYFFNNPLTCREGMQRQAWYYVPCCPSNLSRTWAWLGKYVYSQDDKNIWVHQYISNQAIVAPGMAIEMQSDLPWDGQVRLLFKLETPTQKTLHLRIPAWAGEPRILLNRETLPTSATTPSLKIPTACGYDPRPSFWVTIEHEWHNEDEISLLLEMPVRLYIQDKRLPRCGRMAALGRGPLVYCLENLDNPDVDIFNVTIEPDSLHPSTTPGSLESITSLVGKTKQGQALTFIPYMVWANRGASQMNVFVKA